MPPDSEMPIKQRELLLDILTKQLLTKNEIKTLEVLFFVPYFSYFPMVGDYDGRKATEKRYKRFKTCQKCGKTRPNLTHHINQNYKDNSDINLLALCRACHKRIHKQGTGWVAVYKYKPNWNGFLKFELEKTIKKGRLA